jgi:hypothetical protein
VRPIMRVMFWNTHKNVSINQIICKIAREKDIDIIFLAEYDDNIQSLAGALDMQSYFTLGCDRIKVMGRIKSVEPGPQGTRYSIQIIDNKYILCALHLPSQMSSGHQERRNIVIQTILNDLQDIEKKLGSKRSILLGDFNEDPYEDGCLSAVNFHGLPCLNDALKIYRKIEGRQFEMFYNPMWNLFGDFNSPPGTYYYAGSNPKCSYWHIFDQVMIRACLKSEFVKSSLEIISKAGEKDLLDIKGYPDIKYSDHLPIVFQIREGQS